jgi:hypothetical protein
MDVSSDGLLTGHFDSTANGTNLPLEGSVQLDGSVAFGYHVTAGTASYHGFLFLAPSATQFAGNGSWSLNSNTGAWTATPPLTP